MCHNSRKSQYTSLFARKAAATSEKKTPHHNTTTTKTNKQNTLKADELVNSITTFIYLQTQKKTSINQR